ncbi:MAG TPA: hypothetical protein VEC14_01140 [Reyranellaceae bacterium]|nr:hypothetical protein [Reyranellaceae bacterium]
MFWLKVGNREVTGKGGRVRALDVSTGAELFNGTPAAAHRAADTEADRPYARALWAVATAELYRGVQL